MLPHAATYDPQCALLPHLLVVHPVFAKCMYAERLSLMPILSTCMQGFSGFASLPLPETVSVSEDLDFGSEVGARPSASLEPGMPLPCPALPCPALPCPLPSTLSCTLQMQSGMILSKLPQTRH